MDILEPQFIKKNNKIIKNCEEKNKEKTGKVNIDTSCISTEALDKSRTHRGLRRESFSNHASAPLIYL